MSSFNPDTYLSYASDSNITALKKVQSQYVEQISTAKSNIDKLDFIGWSDPVSTKLSSHCTNLKTVVYPAIETDVNSGNLSLLITQVENLKTKCLEYKKIKDRNIYPSGMSSNAKKWVSGNHDIELTETDEQYISIYRRNKQKKENDLSTCQSNIETILRNIKMISFSATGAQTEVEAVDMTEIDGTITDGESVSIPITSYKNDYGGTTTVTMTTSIIDGMKFTEIRIVETDMDGNTVVDSVETYVVDLNDPRNSKYIDENGEVYESQVAEDGTMTETHTYTTKHNETESDSYSIDAQYYNLVITDNQTGETTTYTINASSSADLAFMRMMYGNAKLSEGFNVGSRLDGNHFLTSDPDGGGIVTIENMFADPPSSTSVTFRPVDK